MQNHIGAAIERLKGWNDATPTDPDEGDREQLGWQLAGQVGARIVPRQRRSQNMQGFGKIFDNTLYVQVIRLCTADIVMSS